MLTLNICPNCGQINFAVSDSERASCPVCLKAWKLCPQDKIVVRLAG